MAQRKYLILIACAGLIGSLDQLTKFFFSLYLEPGQSVPLVKGFLDLSLVHNEGAAFGLFSSLPLAYRGPAFVLLPCLTLLFILFFFSRLTEQQRLSVYALSLVVGGAIGNLVDRLRLGYVVDFLDFHWRHQAHFPAFNLADAAITLGVCLLLLGVVRERAPKGR